MQLTKGKHAGKEITELPLDYLEWMVSSGFEAEAAQTELDRRKGKAPDKPAPENLPAVVKPVAFPKLDKRANLRTLIEIAKPTIMSILPRHVSAERILNVALQAATRNPLLLDCDQFSFIKSLLQASILGLETDTPLGQCYLVPFKNSKRQCSEVQLIIGYQGYVALAYQHERVQLVESHIVREGDEFDYEFGTNKRLIHKIKRDGDRGDMVAAYSVAWLRALDKPDFFVMEASEIQTIEDAQLKRSYGKGVWKDHRESMWRKSPFRRHRKFLPQSPQLARAGDLDEQAEDLGERQIFDAEIEEIFAEPEKTETDRLTERVEERAE